jgi:SAM-dependent methyltransferase
MPGRFHTTVPFYARYREPYPPEFFQAVARRCGWNGRERLIDLGCGPGLLAIGFAPFVGPVTAVDPEFAMLEAARQAAAAAGCQVQFIHSSTEDLPASSGSFNIATIGRALHWMVPERTIARLELLLEADAQILVCSARSVAPSDDHWKHKFDEVRRRWSDDRTVRRYRLDIADYFAHSHWAAADEIVVSRQHNITIDHLVARALSFSSTAPARLQERRNAFEQEIRDALMPFAPAGQFPETVEARAVLLTAKDAGASR